MFGNKRQIDNAASVLPVTAGPAGSLGIQGVGRP